MVGLLDFLQSLPQGLLGQLSRGQGGLMPPGYDGDNNPLPGMGGGLLPPQAMQMPEQAMAGPQPLPAPPMPGAAPGMAPQAPGPAPAPPAPAPMPASAPQSQGPNLLTRLAGTDGILGGMANTLGAITGHGGRAIDPSTSNGPAGQAYRLMISKGMDPAQAKVLASSRESATAWVQQQVKPQSRPMTAEEKTRHGLPANAPWVMNPDGKPSLPEGYATTLPEIKGTPQDGYVGINRADMSAMPVTGVPAAPPKFDEVSKLRTEIQALPSYKNHAQAAPIYKTMIDAADRDTRASDLNIVYGLGKIFDPGSVVREGEMIMVKNTAGLPDWFMGAVNSLNGGAALTPETRKAIMAEAFSRMKSYEDIFDRDTQQYKGIVTRNRMNEADVLPGLDRAAPWQPKPKPPAAAAPAAPDPSVAGRPPAPAVGHIQDGHQFLGGDPSKPASWRKVQ